MLASIRVITTYISKFLLATWLWLRRTLFPAISAVFSRSNSQTGELPITSPAAPSQFALTDCFASYRASTYCNAQFLDEVLPHHDILQCELFGKNHSQKSMSHQFFSDDYLGDSIGLEGKNSRLSSDPLQAPISHRMAALSTFDDISSHFSPYRCSTPPPRRIFDSCDSFAQVERSGSPQKAVSIGKLGQRRGFKGAPLKTSATTPQGLLLSLPSAKSVRSSGRMSPTTPRTPLSSIVNLCTTFSPKSMRSSKQAPLEVYGQDDPFEVNAPSFYTSISAGSTPPWNDDDLTLYLDQGKHKSLHKGGSRSRRSSNAHRIPGHVMKTTIYNVSVGPSLSASRPLATTPKETSEVPKHSESSALPVTPSDVGVVLTPPSPPTPARPPSSTSLSESLKVLIETGASFVDDDPFSGPQAPAPKSVVSTDAGDSSVSSARQERSRVKMVSQVRRSRKTTLELMDPPRQSKAGVPGDEAISDERSLVMSKETWSKVKERGHRTTVKVTTLGKDLESSTPTQDSFPEVSGLKSDHDSNRRSPSPTRATGSSFPDSLKANVKSDTAVPTVKQSMSTQNIIIKTSNGDTVTSGTIKKKRRFSAPSASPSPSKPPCGLSAKFKPTNRVAMREATNTSHRKATSVAGVVSRPVSWIHNLTLAQSSQNRVKVKIIPPTPVLKGPKPFSAALNHSLLVVVDPDDDEAEENIVHGDDAKQRWSRGAAELVAIVNTFDFKAGPERAQLQHNVFPKSSSEGSILTQGKRDSLAFFRSSAK